MGDRPVALVTGGAKRVGRATSLTLARAGFDLVVTYRSSEDEARSLAQEADAVGAACEFVRLSLGDLDDVEQTGAGLARRLDRLDAIVHNASSYSPSPIDEVTPGEALAHYTVNALAPLLLTKATHGLLRESPRPGGGAVVAMCDIHSMGRPRSGFSAYSMSKAALIEMVRTLARELAPDVRVNGIAPGVVAWPEQGHESDDESQRAYLERVPLARAGTPGDASEAVRWLIMDARYCTGQIIRIDGGRFLA